MNENKTNKPATLLKEDFEQGLINLCNSSGLPFFVMEYILKDLYLEVKALAQKQYKTDFEMYKQLNEEDKLLTNQEKE